MRPAFLAPGVRSVHMGTPLLLPSRQHPLESEQPHGPDLSSSWSPYTGLVEARAISCRPSIGDARWTPPALWDLVGLGNQFWGPQANPIPGPVTKSNYGSWFARLGVQPPNPSLPLPQPTVLPTYG